jgi:hypothetical protein
MHTQISETVRDTHRKHRALFTATATFTAIAARAAAAWCRQVRIRTCAHHACVHHRAYKQPLGGHGGERQRKGGAGERGGEQEPARVVPTTLVPERVVPGRVVPARAVLARMVPTRVVPARMVPAKVVPESEMPVKASSRCQHNDGMSASGVGGQRAAG